MTTPLLCVDSDIFTILAAAGRLHRAAELSGFGPADIRRNYALTHQLRSRGSYRDFPAGAKAVALAAAEGVAPLIDRPAEDDTLNRLSKTDGIDVGEAGMFAIMAERPVYWMATADAKSLRALGAAGELADIRCRIAGRVLCFEAVFHNLIRHDGFEETASAFAAVGLSDSKKVRALVRPPGPGLSDFAGVNSYLRAISQDTGGPGSLLHCPPCPGSASGVCTL